MAPQNIAEPWRELNGKNNWEGLLDPLDPDLRQNIINFGELSQAVYDAFNDDEVSRFTGALRYTRHDFFEKVFLKAGRAYNYRVTKFIYATASVELPAGFILKSLTKGWKLKESNWMGYVAVATDEGKAALGRRDVVVAWRGTLRPLEWVTDFEFVLTPADDIVGATPQDGGNGSDNEPRVYLGWMSVYTTENPKSPFNKTCARAVDGKNLVKEALLSDPYNIREKERSFSREQGGRMGGFRSAGSREHELLKEEAPLQFSWKEAFDG